MLIKKFTFNGFQENTYVLSDTKGNCVIVDPGCYDRYEENELIKYIAENKLKVNAVLNTHAHIDHVLGNQFVLSRFPVPFYLHMDDISTLQTIPNYANLYGFDGYKASPAPTVVLKGGENLKFGEIEFKVLHTPGHAPGHVVFYNEKEKVVVNGDVLFKGSFGRVDLPGGSMKVLKKTIFDIMFALPDDTIVLCGHGYDTTIGHEKKTNYINDF
jgi:hydroxyacylglutathione hydrolase